MSGKSVGVAVKPGPILSGDNVGSITRKRWDHGDITADTAADAAATTDAAGNGTCMVRDAAVAVGSWAGGCCCRGGVSGGDCVVWCRVVVHFVFWALGVADSPCDAAPSNGQVPELS